MFFIVFLLSFFVLFTFSFIIILLHCVFDFLDRFFLCFSELQRGVGCLSFFTLFFYYSSYIFGSLVFTIYHVLSLLLD